MDDQGENREFLDEDENILASHSQRGGAKKEQVSIEFKKKIVSQ